MQSALLRSVFPEPDAREYPRTVKMSYQEDSIIIHLFLIAKYELTSVHSFRECPPWRRYKDLSKKISKPHQYTVHSFRERPPWRRCKAKILPRRFQNQVGCIGFKVLEL
jgi:hypothetical protein